MPSVEEDSVELVAARGDGASFIQRTRRSGADLVVHTTRLMRFFHSVRAQTFGPLLDRPTDTQQGRLFKLGARFRF